MTAVEHLTYDRLLDEQPAAAGFTMSIASTVKLARAGTVFVKAGQVGTAAGDAVTTGAQLAPVIGDLGPPLVGHLIVEGWSVAVYDFIAGTALGRWDESAVLEMAEISFRLRERVDPSPITDTTPYAQEFAPLLGCWEALEDPNHPDRRSVEHIVGLDLPNGFEVSALAELERRWFEATRPGARTATRGPAGRQRGARAERPPVVGGLDTQVDCPRLGGSRAARTRYGCPRWPGP
ncbi:hypothetical protein [Ornithinimicrobium sp. Y1694]|uniref:hypothetical protein n=1 Tax=Ornithinimicrobium sp. Y1694 TaxID=3418590 RepID=UPI003CF56D87